MPLPSAGLEEVRRRAAEARTPLHAVIEVTHRCNLRCAHCYLRACHRPRERELDTAEMKRLLDQLRDLQTLFLCLTGGEFFLRDDAFELLSAARARGFVVTLLTNGTLVTPEAARRIRDCSPFRVHVSLLGPEAVHDRLAGEAGAFAKAVRAMDLLRESGVGVTAKLILTRESAPHAAAMQDLARAHADDFVMSVDLLAGIDGEPAPPGLQPSADDIAGLPRTGNAPAGARPAPPPDGPVCNAGRNLLAVSPYGEVFPCVSFRRAAGNLRDRSLAELWDSPLMREAGGIERGNLRDCAGCPDCSYCTFCPGRGWQELGDAAGAAPSLCARARRFRAALEPDSEGRAR